jgi:NAD(P)-dependent dehydrogenase (short-subunit alcohol dehydrogenase family)
MTGKAVLVTGSSTGIGKACALYLASRGHTVFAGVRKESDGAALVQASSGALTPVILEVTDEASIQAAAKTIGESIDDRGLNGLVNNAGVAYGGPLEYLPIESWRMQLEVNVIGQVAVTQAMLPMIRRAVGRIVFIGSIGGRLGTAMMGPYNASKFALEGIAESFRHEMRPWGIKVVLVEPGSIKSEIWNKGRSQADGLERDLPQEALTRYASFVEGVRQLIDKQDRAAIDPVRVAKVIERALFSPRPRPRYLVGVDAKVGAALARFLPDQTKDAVQRSLTGFRPRASD